MLRIVAALKRRSTFDDPAARGLASRLASQSVSDSMEPRSNRIVPVERACFAGQDNERSLKHIIDIGAIP
jgi:hypothetical protein